MRFAPGSLSGIRLRKHGVSSAALTRTTVFAVAWPTIKGWMLPLMFVGPIIFIGKKILDVQLDGELADNEALAPLAHQYCHAHQRLQWGFMAYVWRHVSARLVAKWRPVHQLQVEREPHQMSKQVYDYYQPSSRLVTNSKRAPDLNNGS